ncbi:hypothetical protein OOT33_08050 [Sphingobium sp. DEHP117]|uniref:hypothetical protein n=1 Tax=Sphingobium sp. DEHP117 TaxID=2993436 RepID=UPI0027D50F69|nr:hypothetical protein [Sphingobium sp. DEHP117]MDQ4420385.1 hypothetical protein [Sphingobium sp. DEHP117]
MNTIHRICIWLGLFGLVLMGAGMMPLMHSVPPPDPLLGPDAVKAFYIDNSLGIRIGALLVLAGSPGFILFYVPLSSMMARMEPRSWELAAIQLICGTFAVIPFMFFTLLLIAAAYRPDQAALTIQALADVGWLGLFVPTIFAVPQMFAIGAAVLRDRSDVPIFPRWIGYFNFCDAILFQTSMFVAVFKSGPFAWNGILAFWIPFTMFFWWFIIMMWAMLRALKKHPVYAGSN